jgi:hypothetical protein
MSVEGIPQREVVVTFNRQYASYYAGESAAFTEDEAARLVELGVVGELPPAVTSPPVNVDVPYVSQDGEELNCTMGNWEGTPTGYAYQWQRDGEDIGTDAASYTVTPDDPGHTLTCVVTATNAAGSTTAPPSNGVEIAEDNGGGSDTTRDGHERRRHHDRGGRR